MSEKTLNQLYADYAHTLFAEMDKHGLKPCETCRLVSLGSFFAGYACANAVMMSAVNASANKKAKP